MAMDTTAESALSTLPAGATGVVARLGGGCHMQYRLRSMGMTVGSRVRVVRRSSLGGPILVAVGETSLAIGRGMAERITVIADPS
jgi:ferrous iron transport protein A